MTTRRSFTFGVAGAAAAGLLARPASGAAASPALPAVGGASARGELAERIRLTAERLTRGERPVYSPDFVLADVALDRRRRFWEFSGDLSGRYVEALSILPFPGGLDLKALVAGILREQREDGRFGDPALRYTSAEIAMPHMALLWGNGRLLVGLMQYHAATRDADVLKAARRLADFLVGIRAQAADPAVARRVEGQGAFGIICFTQLIEPLVTLARVTGEPRYLEAARQIAPALGPRGIQHAHGYVTTLRGLLDLAVQTNDAVVLADVERLYAQLAASPDLCWMGGVLEYFGWEEPSVSTEERRPLLEASGRDPRDEGCGIADWLRLSLGLYRATGKQEYLERAERCLLNHLYFNQFTTGDFGSRSFFRQGTKPTENVDRAWWCCTMHGYRAFPDVLASIVRRVDGAARLELFLDAEWEGDGLQLSLRQRPLSPLQSRLTADVRAAKETTLALRRPSWAEAVRVSVNGAPAQSTEVDGYVRLERAPKAGDRIEALFDHRVLVETRDGRRLSPGQLGAGVEGLLAVGPLLYGVDDGQEPLFFGEPWLAGNVVQLPARLLSPVAPQAPARFSWPARHIAARYEHAGFVGTHPVRLRPVGEQAGREPGIMAAWLRYRS